MVAYSTLSQLGYMTVALGVSAYGAGIFHLMTHAFFKALLFLAAGSVIIAMHHEQDMRKMGGLRKYMPITYWTCLVGCLALIGFPGSSGFFSKDSLIEAVHASHRVGSGYAYFCVVAGVFITGALHLPHVHHDVPRQGAHGPSHAGTSARESLGGDRAADPAGDSLGDHRLVHGASRCCSAISSTAPFSSLRPTMCWSSVGEEFHGSASFVLSAISDACPCWLAGLGVLTAYVFFLWRPALADAAEARFKWLYTILIDKFGFDWFNEHVIMAGARLLGGGLWRVGDQLVIDDGLGQRQRAHRRLVGIRHALCAVGIPVSLCLRHDLRIGRTAPVADLAMSLSTHLLSWLIWLPIVGGFVVLALGHRVTLAKWVSLAVSALALLLSIPLWSWFKTGTAEMQFVERSPWISTIHSRVLHRRRRHFDAADPADHLYHRAHRDCQLAERREARGAVHGGVPDPGRV